jgi:hypothetical protein
VKKIKEIPEARTLKPEFLVRTPERQKLLKHGIPRRADNPTLLSQNPQARQQLERKE